ncbi:MAG TPA: hypothetical protein VFG54_13790 [Prolixibacteraceae bacterium]|nr:hypothetical protein [Prolixibacteraceae bacterium]
MKYCALLLLFGGMIILNSCCQKKKCYGVEYVSDIEFIGFTQSELDSVMMVTYEKNSDFCSPIDTFKMLELEDNNTETNGILVMENRLNLNLDYKVIMPRIGQAYELTDFTLKKQECNYCFPTGYDHYTVLDSYKINGQKKINSGLQITKSADQ